MAFPICEDDGFLREWAPESTLIQQIPLKAQKGLFSYDLNLTCIDVVSDYLAVGTNCGLVYWYCRENGELQRLRFEDSNASISCIKVVSTVDFMVAAGSEQGTVTVFQIPKKPPDSIPEALKPKNKAVERFTIDGLHNCRITAIEWSQNGMKLFSGDKNGVVVLTEIDFYMHLSKSTELLNEQFEIVQLSYSQQTLLVSTVFRSIICDGNDKWKVHQIGTKERKILGKFGATFCKFDHGTVIYASRPGHRLWLANKNGCVEQTLIFKSAVQSAHPRIQILNPYDRVEVNDTSFGKLIQFGDKKLIAYNNEILYVLHLGAITISCSLDCARKILDVAVNQDEIYILEGERSLLRLSHVPDKYSLASQDFSASRKSFVLDELASKLKESAVGSIKKIATDFIPIPERDFTALEEQGRTGVSSPIIADEAVELPPIVDLPAGSLPSVAAEKNFLKHRESHQRESLPQTSVEGLRVDLIKESENLFPSEVISRPGRRRNPKKSRTVPNVRGPESESDTTSIASEDRLTWGIADDPCLSEESPSSIGMSRSSFSVLKDAAFLLTSNISQRTEDNKSIDTCESVSERLVSSSERFLEEQERIFGRLADRDVASADCYDTEKTDDMSVSFNATPSSSASSKTGDNFFSNGDKSENISTMSESKTDESPIGENYYGNDRLPLPKNLCFYRPENDSVRSQSASSKTSKEEENEHFDFDLSNRFPSSSMNPDTIRYEIQNNEMILSKLLGMNLVDPCQDSENQKGCDSDDKADGTEIEGDSTKYAQAEVVSDDCECDHEFTTRTDSAGYRESFLPESEREFGLFVGDRELDFEETKKKLERKDFDLADKKLPSLDPLCYGPPSGSSVTSCQPSLEYTSGTQTQTQMQTQMQIYSTTEQSDHWLQYKCPEPIVSLDVCDTYVVCTDVNDQVYYSELNGLALSWTLLDYKASSVAVSGDSSIVWTLYKKNVYGLIGPSKKGPFSESKMEGAWNVRSIAVDKINREGWMVKSDGEIKCQKNLNRAPCGKTEDVYCQWLVTSVACRDGIVLAITSDESVICRRQGETLFRNVKTPCSVTTSVALGPRKLAWIVDDRSSVFFSDDFLEENPHWWQILISEYIFQHSGSVFQNMHNKIRLNNLRANIQLKNTMVATDEHSVWIFDKYSCVIHVNKTDFTGYVWNKLNLSVSLPLLKWETLCAEGIFEDKGHLWLLSAHGDLFCTEPNSKYFQSVPSPCADPILCVASSTDTLWVLSSEGRIYSRLGLTEGNLTGNSWRELHLPGLKLRWASCGCDVAWGCDAAGDAYVTVGPPHRVSDDVFDAAWLRLEDKPKETVRFEKVFVGPQMYMVWALDSKRNVYVREGIFPHLQIGTGWVYVAGIEAVHLTVSGTSVWALSVNGHVYRRHGITESNYIGDYWKRIPGNLRIVTSSFTDDLWGIDRDGSLTRLRQKTVFLSVKKSDRVDSEGRSSGEEGDWEVVL